jgi:hypothetical protein
MEDRPVEHRPQAEPSPEGGVEFVNPADDTPENQAIVALIEERAANDAPPLDLDQVIEEFGYDPAEFSPAD